MNNEQTSETIVERILIAVCQGYGAAWIELPNGNTIWGKSVQDLSTTLSASGLQIDLSAMTEDRTPDFSKFNYNHTED